MNIKCNKRMILCFNIENRYLKRFNYFHNIENVLRD